MRGSETVDRSEVAELDPAATTGDVGPDDTWRDLFADAVAVDRAVTDAVVGATGLLGVQTDLLLRLWQRPGHRSPMNALAAEMRVSGSSLTKLVDRLSDLDLAQRDASESDRRVVYVVLTDHGERQAADIARLYAETLRQRVVATLGGELIDLAELARRLA